MAGSGATIRYEGEAGIARLTLAHGARFNAMTLGMWQALPEAIARAEEDPDIRVIALTGEGDKAFCAGADISEFGEQRSSAEHIERYNAAVATANAALAAATKPTIALIRGICFGGGFGLAMACDLRLARADARFRIPAARVGLGYGHAGVETMVRRIGMPAVAELLLSARILNADEAYHYQIIHRLWPVEDFPALSEAYLTDMAGNAPLSMQAAKRSLIELTKHEAERSPEAVDALVAACFASEDYREGQQALLEKSRPVFRGR
ncbi:MAG: enoyl-CoA hydratase [Beijerinckiaceae bacterium]|nr:enoyl-CoA hydratase [Beijerinckiaceae bacterium]